MKTKDAVTVPASVAYGTAVALRNALYDRGLLRSRRLTVPVVSIGNLTVGGSGKTPVVAVVARSFLDRGVQPAILSRGYRRRSGRAFVLVSDGRSLLADAREAGDEPVELARAVPGAIVAVGPDRFEVGQEVIRRSSPGVILLDDGFQHRRLARDLDLVCVDAGENREALRLLPAGRLREPLSALSRAGALLWTRAREGEPSPDLRSKVEVHVPEGRRIFRACFEIGGFRRLGGGGETLAPDAFRGRSVGVLTAIARPERFREDLERAGARIVSCEEKRDHHYFTPRELLRAAERARDAGAEALLTTGKDAVKLDATLPDVLPLCPLYPPCPLYRASLRIEIDEEARFLDFLASRIKPGVI